MINYHKGDLFAHVDKVKEKSFVVIPHVVNCLGRMGSGFVLPLLDKWSDIKDNYEEAIKDKSLVLGQTQFLEVEPNIVVANMCAQTLGGPRPLFYPHLMTAMREVSELVTNLSNANKVEIIAPKFGSALAGGDWAFIKQVIEDEWTRINQFDVTICYL